VITCDINATLSLLDTVSTPSNSTDLADEYENIVFKN
jgi:hypothetical protein